MSKKWNNAMLASALLAAAVPAMAEDEAPEGWHGKGEFGFVTTSGNTETESLNVGLEFTYESDKWRHRLSGSALRSERDSTTDAQRWTVGAQTDYKFSERSYVFGSVRHDSDRFAGFDPVTTVTAGYGRNLLDNESHFLLGEVGLGYRTQEVADTGETENDAILRGRLDYRWTISPNTDFGNLTLVESGSDNTYFQNDTTFSVGINSKLAVKLAYQYRYNTDPPVGKDDTDTQFTTSLVYNF